MELNSKARVCDPLASWNLLLMFYRHLGLGWPKLISSVRWNLLLLNSPFCRVFHHIRNLSGFCVSWRPSISWKWRPFGSPWKDSPFGCLFLTPTASALPPTALHPFPRLLQWPCLSPGLYVSLILHGRKQNPSHVIPNEETLIKGLHRAVRTGVMDTDSSNNEKLLSPLGLQGNRDTEGWWGPAPWRQGCPGANTQGRVEAGGKQEESRNSLSIHPLSVGVFRGLNTEV